MSKKLNIKLDRCFISTRVINDRAVKDAVYRNIKIVESLDTQNIHQRVIKVMNIKDKRHSKYYDYSEFFKLLKEATAVVVGVKNSNDEFNNI